MTSYILDPQRDLSRMDIICVISSGITRHKPDMFNVGSMVQLVVFGSSRMPGAEIFALQFGYPLDQQYGPSTKPTPSGNICGISFEVENGQSGILDAFANGIPSHVLFGMAFHNQ